MQFSGWTNAMINKQPEGKSKLAVNETRDVFLMNLYFVVSRFILWVLHSSC